MKTQRIIICLLLITFCLSTSAEKKKDLSGWLLSDITINHKRWDYIGVLEFRSKEDMSKMDLFSPGLYGRYRFSPLFKLSAGYEFYIYGDDLIEHRLLLQNESSLKFYNLRIDNRLSFLNDFKNIDEPNWGFRDRLRLKYPIKKFTPYTSFELYYSLRNKGIHSYKNRYTVGLNYQLNRQNEVGIYYMREHYVKKIFTNHIIGVYHSLVIPTK